MCSRHHESAPSQAAAWIRDASAPAHQLSSNLPRHLAACSRRIHCTARTVTGADPGSKQVRSSSHYIRYCYRKRSSIRSGPASAISASRLGSLRICDGPWSAMSRFNPWLFPVKIDILDTSEVINPRRSILNALILHVAQVDHGSTGDWRANGLNGLAIGKYCQKHSGLKKTSEDTHLRSRTQQDITSPSHLHRSSIVLYVSICRRRNKSPANCRVIIDVIVAPGHEKCSPSEKLRAYSTHFPACAVEMMQEMQEHMRLLTRALAYASRNLSRPLPPRWLLHS